MNLIANHIDIHDLVEGAEIIGFSPTVRLRVVRAYQESDDAELYNLPPEFEKLPMLPGRFAMSLPVTATCLVAILKANIP